MSTTSYKQFTRNQRLITPEAGFNGGMVYTDNPLATTQSRLLVNLDLVEQGLRLKPRGGFKNKGTTQLTEGGGRMYTHHIGSLFVKLGDDALYRRYVLTGPKNNAGTGMLFSEMKLLIEDPITENLLLSTLTGYAGTHNVKIRSNMDWDSIHNVHLNDPFPDGVYASIEGNTYLMTDVGLARLVVTYNNGNYTHTLEDITPKALTATEAVNYGYNMLLTLPYNFPIVQGPALRLDGILPYVPDSTTLKMNARVGETVRFKLNYQYPAGAPTYKVEWKTQDITRSDNPTIVQTAAASPTYTAGQDIFLDYVSPFKQFSVIATVYASTDLNTPLKSITLAAYALSDDSTQRSKNMEPRKFDLRACEDMCAWNGHIALWGVDGANMTLFLSDLNNPAYFPFPNNVQIYDEEVLKAVPVMNNLLVLTETKLHLLSMLSDGTYSSVIVQDSMKFSKADANTVIAVKNMAFFKSAAYYYMIVPKKDSTELQIAPISRPISYLLDNFEFEIQHIINLVYTLDFTLKVPQTAVSIQLQCFHNYLDNATINNVYKYKIAVEGKTVFLDVILCYDTVLRAWTIKMMESNNNRMLPYRRIATESVHYVNITESNGYAMQRVKVDPQDPADTFNLDGNKARTIKNYQLLDTGKRNLEMNLKKRFRSIIFEINNISKKNLLFNDIFLIDDEHRSELFDYNVVHVTDIHDPKYGTIYVERKYRDPILVPGPARLGEWTLDLSAFADVTVVRAELDCTGKGYYPRVMLVSRNEAMYELNNISWVYRIMNGR